MKSAGSKMLMLTAAVLTVVGGVLYFGREKSIEITFIQFQNELLASGFVDHVDIVNKSKVRSFTSCFVQSSNVTLLMRILGPNLLEGTVKQRHVCIAVLHQHL